MRNSKSDSKRSRSSSRSRKERKAKRVRERWVGWEGVGWYGSRHDIKVSRLIKKPLKS